VQYEDRKIISILLLQKVRDFGVDDQAVMIVLMLDYLDQLKILGFGDFLFFPLARIKGQIVAERHNGRFANHNQISQAQGCKCNNNPIGLHKAIDPMKVPNLKIPSCKYPAMDLINKHNRILQIHPKTIISQLISILHILITAKCPLEPNPPVTCALDRLSALLRAQVLPAEEPDYFAVLVYEVEHLGNASHLC